MNYEEIQLTEDELKLAILEGKKKKYFSQKHSQYWIDQEQKAVEAQELDNKLRRQKRHA